MNSKAKNKKAQAQMFNWIFAIFVGVIILFLALFGTFQYIKIQRYRIDTEIAMQIGILLNPLETSMEIATATEILMPSETKILLKCDEDYEELGKQDLSIKTASRLGKKWEDYGAAHTITNKYIYADNSTSNKLYVFSKSFSFPFKIADLIYVTAKDYCFVDPPDNIKDELLQLNISNINVNTSLEYCKSKAVSVCFGENGECEISVYGSCDENFCPNSFEYGEVIKDNEVVYYATDALLYAAIFSETDNYKCNLKRLLSRIEKLSQLYNERAIRLYAKGCGTADVQEKLVALEREAEIEKGISNPNLALLYSTMNELEDANSYVRCEVY